MLPSKGIPEKRITAYGAKVHNRYERALSRLRDRVAAARSFRCTADYLGIEIAAVLNSVKLPPYERGMLAGWATALREEIWNRHVRWQLYLDGARVTTREISAVADREESEGEDRAATWARVLGRHEWDNGDPFTELGPTTGLGS